MSRPVCRYWQQGNCKFGSNCRFEHPNRNQNSFSALSGGGSNRSGGAKFLGELPYRLDKDVIQKDLTEDKPIWILSAYSPGKDAPEQLFGGYPREQSFEEIRLHYEMAAAAGNPQGALNEIEALYNNAQQQHQQVLGNIDAAIDFIIAAENKHPNRIDICKSSAPAGGTTGAFSGSSQVNAFSSPQSSSPFQTSTAPTTGAFGQPSALGQKPNPFSGGGGGGTTSAFGQPSQLGGGTTSAFGQPSQLGGATTSAFGQPSKLGGGSAFGQPSAMSQNSAFGQTSALGQKPNPFGGGSGSSGTSAFGQPSSLGQNSAFGQPAQPATSSAFGQPAQASSGFGQPSALGQKPNPFGAASSAATASPSPFASAANASATPAANPFLQKPATSSPSPFAQQGATPPANPFGQPQPQASGFGAPAQMQDNAMDLNKVPPASESSGFGATTTTPAPANPFAQVQSQGQAPSGFGQPAANSNSTGFGFGSGQQTATAPTAAKSENPYAPDASRQHPPLSSYATKGPDGRLQSWKGKPVAYKMIDERPTPGIQGFDGTFCRIWFPDGPPAYYRDTEPASAGMTYTNKETAAWEEFKASGRFKLGSMPEMPPMREFCSWDI